MSRPTVSGTGSITLLGGGTRRRKGPLGFAPPAPPPERWDGKRKRKRRRKV